MRRPNPGGCSRYSEPWRLRTADAWRFWATGMIADELDSFAGAMEAVCVPGALSAALFALLPETRGLDLERSAPEERSPHS